VKHVRWPAVAEALPPGPVRDAIAPVIGVRALMVFSDERRRVRRLELSNSDGKTVARVDLDEPASTSATTAEPAHLTVHRLRGYDEQARRAERLLAGLGLLPVEPGDDAGQRASRSAQTAGADRAVPARVHLTAAMSGFLATMRDNLPGLLEDVDTEFLHDFRVAVRRTRATLKLGRPVLPEVMRSRWEPAFRSIGDLTTPVRDLDVYELSLPAMTHWLVTANPSDLDPLAVHLKTRRTAARRVMVRSLRSAAFRRQVTGWGEELTLLPVLPQEAGGEPLSAGDLADRSISRVYRRVARDGAVIGADSPASDLHNLRKRCKELRYALEVFAPLIDQAAGKRAVADLKGLQDVLGRFQDSEVQRQAMRGFAEEMMAEGTTAGAMLAMGELIGHLDVEQERARREFDAAFARFERPSSLRLIHRLEGER
jgi:CHAD domain-containing protein